MNLYDYTVKSIDGKEVSMTEYCGKVLLIVNTASKCGFTPQYAGLEELYEKFKDKGFAVLGFPCNQFKDQEPEPEEKILEFCQSNYGVSFPMFSKIDVNGPNACPLYEYLKGQKEFQGFQMEHPLGKKLDEILSAEDKNYASGNDIKWNFTKFLVDQHGKVVKRYEPTADMNSIEKDIGILLM